MEIIEKQLAGIYAGARAIIEPVGPRRSKFIREKQGLECLVVSCNRRAAIVEIPSLGELLVCKMKDLRPVNTELLKPEQNRKSIASTTLF
jgi:hypothetical protein